MEKNIYKYSRYNIVAQDTRDKVLLYNAYSLKYRYIQRYDFLDIYNKCNIDLGDVPVFLAEEGFIVPVELDEIQKLKDDIHKYQENADFMFLSIFTTLSCNFRCVYCFEQKQLCQTENLTTETADEIIAFIKRRYAEHQFKKPLKIKWFGGEPLLNMEIIRYISNELHKNKIDYNAKLYTNGRLLTRELALELKELGVTDEVVIPIDGLASTYAALKGCKEEDFYEVLNNIKDCENTLRIVIHINVSEASKEDVQPLFNLLKNDYGIKSKIVAVRVAPQNTDTIMDTNDVSFEDYQKATDIVKGNRRFGKKRGYGCEARLPDYYVIGTKGELYICEHLIGQQEYMVGNIKDQSKRINRTDTIWDSNRIIDDCIECPLLPLCVGQCTSMRFIDNIDCQKELRIEDTKKRLLEFYGGDNIRHYEEDRKPEKI